MEDQSMVGAIIPLKIDNRVVEQYPVKIKYWPEFTTKYGILRYPTLQEIFRFSDGGQLLRECCSITSQKPVEELKDYVDNWTQADYKTYRELIISQNDLNLDSKTGENKDPKKA